MNPIMSKFEEWYDTSLTPRQREFMFDFNNGRYTYMATRMAYEAFLAGYNARGDL